MSSYNHRPRSPIRNPGRASDNNVTSDGYYQQRHSTYASPRTSTSGVIPISTQTFINVPQAQPSPAARQYLDAYSGRPRRSSHADQTRGVTASSSTTALPSRSRPTVIQQEVTRPASPTKITPRDIYVTPNSSQEPRVSTTTHKKLYSVDGDGSAKLVADVNIPAGGDRHHKRRESTEKSGYRTTGVERERERGRRGAAYHTNGSHNRPRDKSIEDEDAYSYTDPASMYRDTEPRWREVQRPRRGSLDRGSRERPVSMIDPVFARQAVKESGGPPPSTRGWDKIHDNLGRTTSVRDAPRPVAQSPTRGRHAGYADYGESNDAIYAPRNSSTEGRRTTIHNYDPNYDYAREPRPAARRHSITRRPDPSLERRGFGINPNLGRDDSQTRYARPDGRHSEDSFEQPVYRDSGYAEPVRRETAPQPHASQYQDNGRLDQEKRDREYALRLQAEDRDRVRDRDARDPPAKLPQRREDDRGHDRDYERPRERDHDRLTERERERDRYVQPPADRKDDRKEERRDDRKDDRDRQPVRRDTDRDREYGRKKDKEDSPRRGGEAVSKPSLSQAATGGLAGAAAASGLTGLINKVTDKRDKDSDEPRERSERERDRSRDRRADRDRQERERERERERDRPERFADDRERHRDDRDRRDPGRAASDEDRYGRDRERDRPQKEEDRGLGFAFEAPPEPPRTAPPPTNDRQQGSFPPPERAPTERSQDRPQERPVERAAERPIERPSERLAPVAAPERPSSRQGERSHPRPEPERTRDSDSDSKNGRTDMPGAPISAEEDYRRRMEQIQRELGVASAAQRAADADPDRERRRREREQRQRERETRNGGSHVPYPDSNSSSNTIPIPAGTRGSFERDDVSNVTGMTGTTAHDSVLPDLHRKPSILDRPMTDEPYQIIDNSQSDRRENRVRIVDPPTEQEDKRPRGILKKPTEKFPEDNHAIREGVAPLKDATKKGIPPGARWTKIDRRLVNPEALEAAQERFEERLDCVIVLRVLTKEEIQKLADKTRDIRDKRYEDERSERKSAPRKSTRNRDRYERGEYEYSDSEDEFQEKAPKMLEAPSTAGASSDADFIRENQRRHERDRDSELNYMSGGLGARDDGRRREEPHSRY